MNRGSRESIIRAGIETGMRWRRCFFLVTTEAYDSIVGDKVMDLCKHVEIAVKRVQASGKMKAGGILGGILGAFMLLEMTESKEIFELLGGDIIDRMHVQVDPIIDFKDLGEFFAKDAGNV